MTHYFSNPASTFRPLLPSVDPPCAVVSGAGCFQKRQLRRAGLLRQVTSCPSLSFSRVKKLRELLSRVPVHPLLSKSPLPRSARLNLPLSLSLLQGVQRQCIPLRLFGRSSPPFCIDMIQKGRSLSPLALSGYIPLPSVCVTRALVAVRLCTPSPLFSLSV